MALTNEDRELAFTPAYELVRMMKSKRLSPVELMEAILRRIAELNPKLGAYLTVADEQAMKGARQSEAAISKGKDLGLLHGLPVSIKDLCNTKGIRTTRGSLLFKDFVPDTDGPVVALLKAAGAIIVGKTQTSEFGLCCAAENKVGPPARNPWDKERTSGGSSGGAGAAAAAGISPIADGTDGGGSLRLPASLCGLYGLKPTTIVNRVPYDPDPATGVVMEFATHGPMTRNVRDAALMMNVISGPYPGVYNCIHAAPPDFLKALDSSLKKLRIAWSRDLGFAEIDLEYTSIAEKAVHAFEKLGHVVEEATPPIGNPFKVWENYGAPQCIVTVGPLYDEHANELMLYSRQTVEYGRQVTSIDVVKAICEIGKWRGMMRNLFEKYDLLLTPSSVPAWPVGDVLRPNKPEGYTFMDWEYTPFTPQFNLTGHPGATCPCGFTSNGLPVGLQIIGRLEDEVTVLQASAAFEKVRPWADKRPPVS